MTITKEALICKACTILSLSYMEITSEEDGKKKNFLADVNTMTENIAF